jgi:hypothetical protein
MTSYRVQRAFREATAALGELVKLEQQFGIERALQIAHRQIKHDGDHQGPRESDT